MPPRWRCRGERQFVSNTGCSSGPGMKRAHPRKNQLNNSTIEQVRCAGNGKQRQMAVVHPDQTGSRRQQDASQRTRRAADARNVSNGVTGKRSAAKVYMMAAKE
jgi:hypothetical protein